MLYKGKRILVTGSSGFIGKKLVSALENEGGEVVPFDLDVNRDVRSWEAFEKCEPTDVVMHLAALMFVPYSWENPREVYEVNVTGTLNALEYARKNNVTSFVFASSYLYGVPEYLPVDEEHPLHPTNPYARSKEMGEVLCGGYTEDYGLRCVSLRPFNIYGPGGDPRMLIPSIIKQLPSGRIELLDSEPKRDYIHVDDVVKAYLLAGLYQKQGFEAFNIGSGESHSVREIVDMVVELSGMKTEVVYAGEKRRQEIPETKADTSKAKERLGWSREITLAEGLRRMSLPRT